MLFLPTIVLAVLQLFLSVLLVRVYVHTKDKTQVLLLLLITISLTIWTIINTTLLIDISSSEKIPTLDLINKFGFFLGAISTVQIYNFSYYFPVLIEKSTYQKWLIYLLFALSLAAFAEPFSGHHTYNTETGIADYTVGSLYLLYVFFLIFNMYHLIKTSALSVKGNIENKKKVKLIVWGLLATAVHGLLFIVILPLILGESNTLYVIGYIAPVFFVYTTVYSLLKRQLFDFRTVAIRATIYVFTTVITALIYVIIAFLFKRLLLPDLQLSFSQLGSNISLTVVLVLLYPNIKKIFDKFTSRLFFRDSYDSQILLDRLNQTLVANVVLESLLDKSAKVLQDNIKNDFCTFHIRETSYFPSRIISSKNKNPEIIDMDDLEICATKIHRRVYSAEAQTDEDNDKLLNRILKKNNIEVMARLVTTLDYDVKGIGYIFMGQKRSGSLYSTDDLKIIEIIASELVIAIENALRYEEIEQFNVTLQKKIDDATKELKESNEKLKALDEAKDEFVSMASHQLRTPLTSIKGYISMVLEGDAGKISDTQAKMLGQAFFSSQRMVYLISDLLNVSRLKTGKFVIESKPVYLPDIVESEVKQLVEGANAKNLTLTFAKPKEFATMNLDEMKLRQVIMNFTDNAIYYTPSGGKITVALKETPKSVEFTVRDNGIGVPKEQQHKLFVKFYRADNARKARPDGTGLGLFMAKKVIIAQGGSMIFESAEGKGSTFGFSFPKEKLLVTETSQAQSK